MKPRKWDPKEKAKIVLEGLKGKPVAEICNEYQINQSQYYQWRDQFLSNAGKAFDSPKKTSQELRLKSQVHQLRALVGELTLELKKAKRSSYEKIVFRYLLEEYPYPREDLSDQSRASLLGIQTDMGSP